MTEAVMFVSLLSTHHMPGKWCFASISSFIIIRSLGGTVTTLCFTGRENGTERGKVTLPNFTGRLRFEPKQSGSGL